MSERCKTVLFPEFHIQRRIPYTVNCELICKITSLVFFKKTFFRKTEFSDQIEIHRDLSISFSGFPVSAKKEWRHYFPELSELTEVL
jgi:hypothetical protein